jgi:hypothetical protein
MNTCRHLATVIKDVWDHSDSGSGGSCEGRLNLRRNRRSIKQHHNPVQEDEHHLQINNKTTSTKYIPPLYRPLGTSKAPKPPLLRPTSLARSWPTLLHSTLILVAYLSL